ncbi:unnamed protein product [Adineta steineri]|uniref:AD domain-containing protein n=1 Tax=Adineta steineri TaxID=433720 RepID=A0A818NFH0_9BILA|nr:unnamed protein product [Adineta steineri]CAF3603119.1 unnamed protein product [Adineta steineri]
MRPMDHHDNTQNSTNNVLKRENSNHSSSPISASSPPLTPTTNIRINSTLRITTMFDNIRTGKVVAYDPSSNLVTLHIKGSKPGTTSVAVINLNHCREHIVEQEPNDETLDPLYPVDINKLKKRQTENEAEKRKEALFVNIKASRIGQALFRDIKKTMNQVIRWSNNDILINNCVRISEPYRSENVSIDAPAHPNSAASKASAKGDNDTKTHIIKLVEKFWSDPSKSVPNNDLTRTKSDNSSKTTDTNESTSTP